MSAELLREAESLMRERAEAACYTYTKDHPDPAKAGQPVPWFDAADAYCFDDSDGPHIMAWSPAVALAVADWLDVAARDLWAHGTDCYTVGHEPCWECDDDGMAPHVRSALAVAHAYLGRES